MTSLLRFPCQSISDAFSEFCLRVYVTFLTCSLYPQQKCAYSVLHREWELFCLTSTQTRMFIRDGDKGGRGRKSEGSIAGANPEDQECRGPPPEQQNVKAVSARHCAATSVPRNYCPYTAVRNSHEDNVRSSAVGKQLML